MIQVEHKYFIEAEFLECVKPDDNEFVDYVVCCDAYGNYFNDAGMLTKTPSIVPARHTNIIQQGNIIAHLKTCNCTIPVCAVKDIPLDILPMNVVIQQALNQQDFQETAIFEYALSELNIAIRRNDWYTNCITGFIK